MRLKLSFTLVEITVALTVFALIMASAGSVFFFIQDSWRRQKIAWDLMNNAEWAMEFITNEARQSDSLSVNNQSYGGGTSRVLYINTHLGLGHNIRYWVSNSSAHGAFYTLYRGEGPNFSNAISSKMEVAYYIANTTSNGTAYNVFEQNGDLLTITLVIRPRPQSPDAKGNRSITLQTKARARN